MSSAYRCRECGRHFAHFALRPPGCATPDLCDVQAVEIATSAAPSLETDTPPAPAPSPASTPPPAVASASDAVDADPLAAFFNEAETPAPERPVAIPSAPMLSEAAEPVAGATWQGWVVRGELTTGRTERACYLVNPETSDGAVWRAIAAPISPAAHERLERVNEPALLKPESLADGVSGSLTRVGRRLPWSLGRTGKDTLSALLRDLAPAINALHREGLAHLRISPASLWYEITPAGPRFALAGLEDVVFTGAPVALRREHDLDHDAPELLGRHVRVGQALRAADWFSLGRIAQTLLLGEPVFERLFPLRDGNATERAALMEAHLREEHGDHATRAGAVEAAHDGELTQPQTRLLRGLLTTNPAGRWGFAEIGEWLRHRSPVDHYGMHARQTMFRLGDRAYTIEEAAAALASPELWSLAAAEVFERNRPNSLAAYVTGPGSDPKFGETWDRLMRLYREGAFGRHQESRREIVTGLFLGFLAGGRVGLSCGGQRFNRALLIERVQAARRDPAAWEWCEAMCRGTTVQEVEAVDPDSAPILQAWREPIFTVQTWLDADGLPVPESQDERTDLMLAALAAEGELEPKHVALRENFAASDIRRVHDWLSLEQPTRNQLVYLVYITGGTRRDRLGLVTHEEWTDRETRRLLSAAADPALLLMWLRLRRALRWAWFLRRGWFGILLFWSPVGVAAWHLAGRRDYHWGALAAVAVGAIVKAALYLLVRWRVARLTGWKNPPPALLRPATCTRQFKLIAPTARPPRSRELTRRIRAITAELGRLRRPHGNLPHIIIPSMAPIWLLSLTITGLWVALATSLWLREGKALEENARTAWREWSERKTSPTRKAPKAAVSPFAVSGPQVQVYPQPGDVPEPKAALSMADLRRRADQILLRARIAANASPSVITRNREQYEHHAKLAGQGNAAAALAAGLIATEDRPGVGINLQDALRFFELGAKGGDLGAQVELAWLTFRGVPGLLPANPARARPVLEAANLQGHGAAAHYLGLARLKEQPRLTTANADWASAHFMDGSSRGHLPSYYELALLHLERRRSNPSLSAAARALREAADQGHRPSAALYSVLLRDGLGFAANPEEANRYERIAQMQ